MALTDSLISYYTMDEASGNRADSAGSNTLTDNGSVGSTTGLIGTAASFSGANYLSGGDDTDFEMASGVDFTFNWWMKAAGSTTQRGLLTKGYDDFQNDVPWYLSRWNTGGSSGALDFFLRDAGSNNAIVSTSGLGDNAWHMVTVVYDATANTLTLYKDGSQADQATSVNDSAYGTNTSNFIIGMHAGSLYDGAMDELGFWKRALSGAEVTQLYNGGAGLAYPFSGGGSTLLSWWAWQQFGHPGHLLAA